MGIRRSTGFVFVCVGAIIAGSVLASVNSGSSSLSRPANELHGSDPPWGWCRTYKSCASDCHLVLGVNCERCSTSNGKDTNYATCVPGAITDWCSDNDTQVDCGDLSFDPPAADGTCITYVNGDPNRPVPVCIAGPFDPECVKYNQVNPFPSTCALPP
jgi:hypothetical protein